MSLEIAAEINKLVDALESRFQTQQDNQLNILPPAPNETIDVRINTPIDTETIEIQTEPEEIKLTYAEAANKPSTSKSKILLLYQNKDTEEKNLVKLLKTVIKIVRDFQIKDVRKLKNDGIAVDCPSQQNVVRIGNNPSLQVKIKPISIKKSPVPHQRTYRQDPLGFSNASVHLQTTQEKTKANHRLGNSHSQRILECKKMFQMPISGTHSHPLHSRKDFL
ncbi:hypothetical protein AVEN_228296-1 [Araneus ventricosus]|uniref:Uncharacterized protein n=1 Tax=Araneus ventricosus TaxID=182803 RepID=A0A4Y2IGG4_ARAVE|nr:hypothetical protein AVEN_228296-1 [Araneus ventricosus]